MLTLIRRALAALAVVALSGAGVLVLGGAAHARDTAVTLEISLSPTELTPKDDVQLEVLLTPNGETVCTEPPKLALTLDRETGEFRDVSRRESGWTYVTSLGALDAGRHTVTVTASDGCAVSEKAPAAVTATRTFVVGEADGSGEHDIATVSFSGTTYDVTDPKEPRAVGAVKVDLIDLSAGLDSEPVASTASREKTGAFDLDLEIADERDAREFVVRFGYPSGAVVYYGEKADAESGSPSEAKAATVVTAGDAGSRAFDAYLARVGKGDEPAPGDDEPPVESPPAETPPAEEPPAETPPAETPPAEEPPAEASPAETPPAETPPADDPPADDEPAEQPTDEPAEQPTSGDPTLSLQASVGDEVGGTGVEVVVDGLADGALWNVVVRSTPQTIGSGSVGVSGIVSRTLAIPAGLEAGWHSLTFTSTLAGGAAVQHVLWFRVDGSGRLLGISDTAPAGGGSGSAAGGASLAATGSTFDLRLVGLALLMIGVGAATALADRRVARRAN